MSTSYLTPVKSGNIRSFKEFVQDAPKLPKTWGENTNDIISTNDTILYLLDLLKERHQETGKNYILTTSVTTVSNLPDYDRQSIESISTFLADNYATILREHSDVSGIYTVLNVSAGKDNISHQNWLYFSVEDTMLLRFEPSSDFDSFRTRELCQKIVEKLKKNGYENANYKIADKGLDLNYFMGRLTAEIKS